MSDSPTISVIMPVRNGEKYIADALKTILDQAWPVQEILVVDDGSTDRSREIVETLASRFPAIHVLDGPRRGPGPARNVGLRIARGEFIGFLDCDDLWPADKLSLHLARFARTPHMDVVSGFVSYFNRQMTDAPAPDPAAITDELFHVHLGATLYRRTVFDRVGIFDENFLYSEDVDLMLRIREADIPMTILNAVTLCYRRHAESMTSTYTVEEKRDFNRALMQSLMRRRKSGNTRPLPPFKHLMEE